MDKISEKLANVFGSGPFIIFHVIWFGGWVITNSIWQFDKEFSTLTIIVSLEAIFLSLFIMRAENIQSARLEKKVQQDLKQTKIDIANTKAIKKKLDIKD